MLGERQTAFELVRGHEVGKDEERGSLDWLAAEDATPAAIAPCPPVPAAQVAADDGSAAPLHPPAPNHRTLVLVAGGIAVFALAAFLATGGSDGAQQPAAADTVAASGLVASVVVPDPMAVRRPASSISTRSETRRHHRAAKHGGSKDSSDGSGEGSSSGGSGSGTGGGGGGSDDSAPLATVNLPVVGPVTVEQPDLPPVPDANVPDLPDVPVPDVPAPKLP